MVDNEKQENLANARRKLKKFRDQQQKQNGSEYSAFTPQTNGNDVHLINGAFNEPTVTSLDRSRSNPQDLSSFVNEQQAILNGIHENLSKSPVADLEEQNRQYALLIENQKHQRARLEDQRQYGVGSSMSGRSSQTQSDLDFARQIEQKYRRDLEHLQEQLEIHVQTIGILVAEKTDLAAKLTQAIKQSERKQSEADEIQGRLKSSRERIEELERLTQNSTSNAQKQDLAVKESDREIDRLRIENNRQSQTIEDLKQNLSEMSGKFNQRHSLIEQLNTEMGKLKQKVEQSDIRLQQYQSINDTSLTDSYEQQIDALQKTIQLQANEIEALHSSINQIRSDNEQTQVQYQQYNSNVQRHVQELNGQIEHLAQTNQRLVAEQETLKQTFETKLIELQTDQTAEKNTITADLQAERDGLRQENRLCQAAINEWSTHFETVRAANENMTAQLTERDEHIAELESKISKLQENSVDHEQLLQSMHEDKTTLSRAIAQNKQLKEQLIELQDGFVKMSNDNMNLTNQVQAQTFLNKQLNERLSQNQSAAVNEMDREQAPNVTNEDLHQQSSTTQQFDDLVKENHSLRERLSQLEQQPPVERQPTESTALSSVSSHEDETIQMHNGFIQKIIDRFNRAMRDNADLQDRTQQLEHLILQLQSETDTIGDYISLYQQQRHQLHRRYQEKDDYIKQLTQDRLNLQRKLSELESLLLGGLKKPSPSIPEPSVSVVNGETTVSSAPATHSDAPADENEWPEMFDGAAAPLPTSDLIVEANDERTTLSTSSLSLANFDDQTKTRILTLLKELGETNSSSQSDHLATTKLAFIGKNLYVCSTCTGPVQWV